MNKYIASMMVALVLGSCSNFLDVKPTGILDEETISTPENVEGFVTSAYSALGNDNMNSPFSLWPYGNVRSDDAYKGGSGTNDGQDFHFFEISENVLPSFGNPDAIWYSLYIAISRVNNALRALESIEEANYPKKIERIGEMRFLRGHFYFKLKILFKYVPYIDEDIAIESYGDISNRANSNDELWSLIASDFRTAVDLLPEVQTEPGRADLSAAYAYLAKTLLYQAYQQDENHNVIGINTSLLEEVVSYCDMVDGALESDFAYNFLPGSYENGVESVFAIQFSHDDGTLHGRLNYSDVLSVPQGIGCCDFHKPSQNLFDAYEVNEQGLPMFDTFDDEYINYANIRTRTMDSRIYHTIAIPGIPYKYIDGFIYNEGWNRNPSVYGYYASLKENVDPSSEYFVNIDPFYGNSKNRIEIRYADVLLFKAEALIELGRHTEALPIINEVRKRANQSLSMISYVNNTRVGEYVDGENCIWSLDFARTALRWERRLEFAMEGSRFFDLVRWGIAGETMNAYYNVEKNSRNYYTGAKFDEGKDEYCPIPQQQIDFSLGKYTQNTNY